MENAIKERRRTSYNGLLDAAIRSIGKLAASRDPAAKALANQALHDLMQVRREMPTRREFDTKPPRPVR